MFANFKHLTKVVNLAVFANFSNYQKLNKQVFPLFVSLANQEALPLPSSTHCARTINTHTLYNARKRGRFEDVKVQTSELKFKNSTYL